MLYRATTQCAIVGSVLEHDPACGRTSTASADRPAARVRELGASVQWSHETHVHADHLSAAPYLERGVGGRLPIGSHITTVQQTVGKLFNAGPEFARGGSQFDRLFDDGDTFPIDVLEPTALLTPGHTLA